MMRIGLQLKVTQQLAMTPQLQKAIQLLQLSSLELCQEIQAALENNPLLETDEEYSEISVEEKSEIELIDTSELMENENIADESPMDVSSYDLYTAGGPSGTMNDYRYDELPIYQGETHQSLNDYLMWQLNLTPFSEQDHAIAVSIIESIDGKGYLTSSLQEILDGQGNNQIEIDEIKAVLKRIQHFDPIGVGSRNLKECLMIQLSQFESNNNEVKWAKLIIENYLDLLAQKDFKLLMKRLNISESNLKDTIDLIQQLQPYPSDLISTEQPEYVIPDIFIKKIENHWQVIINNEFIPKLKINQYYAAMEKITNETDSQYIRHSLQEANWLIKSIENRNDTLTKVSQFIVEYQQDFFEYGEEHMKPMILSDVAEAINMHESTISRITTSKYLQCPRGIFELKYFFSNQISADLSRTSTTAIKAFIKKLINNEDSQKPLSDSKIVSLLEKKNIIIARRTVAKYRELLLIPPSSQRKKLK